MTLSFDELNWDTKPSSAQPRPHCLLTMNSEPSTHLLCPTHLLLLLLLLAGPAHLTPAMPGSQARGQRGSSIQEQDAIKVRVEPSAFTRTCTCTDGSSRGAVALWWLEVCWAGTRGLTCNKRSWWSPPNSSLPIQMKHICSKKSGRLCGKYKSTHFEVVRANHLACMPPFPPSWTFAYLPKVTFGLVILSVSKNFLDCTLKTLQNKVKTQENMQKMMHKHK